MRSCNILKYCYDWEYIMVWDGGEEGWFILVVFVDI